MRISGQMFTFNDLIVISQEVNYDCAIFVEIWRPAVDKTPALFCIQRKCGLSFSSVLKAVGF